MIGFPPGAQVLLETPAAKDLVPCECLLHRHTPPPADATCQIGTGSAACAVGVTQFGLCAKRLEEAGVSAAVGEIAIRAEVWRTERATVLLRSTRDEHAGTVQIQSPRLFRKHKSRCWLRKQLATGFELSYGYCIPSRVYAVQAPDCAPNPLGRGRRGSVASASQLNVLYLSLVGFRSVASAL
jgi:hypothetical protein